MKKTVRQIVVLALILLAIWFCCRVGMNNTYTASLPIYVRELQAENIRIVAETPGVIRPGTPQVHGRRIRLPVHPDKPGETYVEFQNSEGEGIGMAHFHVGRFGTVYDSSSGGFTGDSVVLSLLTVFFLLASLIVYRFYRGARGSAFYAYGTIHAVGLSLFLLLTGVTLLIVTLRHVLWPGDYIMLSAYQAICSSGWWFMMLTAPLVFVFAVAMAVSNIALLRHERLWVKNLLGIAVSVLLVAGDALAYYLYSRNVSGSEWEVRLWDTLCNVYASGFAWFECMLFGAIVCGIKAARHVPQLDADYILILGCKFRKDGTLTPLLRGRVDKAIEFWKNQRALTGREATLMPSGGQGSDEPIPEAEAMRRYLLQQGIPEERIEVEDKSRNTYQNMAYSKTLIEEKKPGAVVVYATTNYHVFRSGVWASLAGLPAEGVGSRTKWWYWPNAFMRECVGLLANRIPQEIALMVTMILFFGLLSIALTV